MSKDSFYEIKEEKRVSSNQKNITQKSKSPGTTLQVSFKEEGRSLYDYQKKDIDIIFERLDGKPKNYRLLYQLPTGGGKTVIFSEIVRRYIEQNNKKAVVLTHRIELCKQTSKMLLSFNVKNKIINSLVKELEDQDKYSCFVAMVETLKNRLSDAMTIENVGLVIVDEAHYNSFRKLLVFFKDSFILGVTATPLSSNIKLPMNEVYDELVMGHSIRDLIKNGFLAKANTYSYEIGLSSLKVGINGDYTVKSSDELYSNIAMQELLLHAYEEHAYGKKTLIFNNGISTSLFVYQTFLDAGYDVRHLDNTNSVESRKEILSWFKETSDAILTSVGILTTGFDEPTVEVVILNRATKSLTLYLQMIGRGSRILPNKDSFSIIDLGNNIARFGLWTENINWQTIFKSPDFYLDSLRSDTEIESCFEYQIPLGIKEKFSKTIDLTFDIETTYKKVLAQNLRPKVVLEQSLEQHVQMCVENSKTPNEARLLAKELYTDIETRIKKYTTCISKSSKSYQEWLMEDYKIKLNLLITKKFLNF